MLFGCITPIEIKKYKFVVDKKVSYGTYLIYVFDYYE